MAASVWRGRIAWQRLYISNNCKTASYCSITQLQAAPNHFVGSVIHSNSKRKFTGALQPSPFVCSGRGVVRYATDGVIDGGMLVTYLTARQQIIITCCQPSGAAPSAVDVWKKTFSGVLVNEIRYEDDSTGVVWLWERMLECSKVSQAFA